MRMRQGCCAQAMAETSTAARAHPSVRRLIGMLSTALEAPSDATTAGIATAAVGANSQRLPKARPTPRPAPKKLAP